jgi:hypothetical protein
LGIGDWGLGDEIAKLDKAAVRCKTASDYVGQLLIPNP